MSVESDSRSDPENELRVNQSIKVRCRDFPIGFCCERFSFDGIFLTFPLHQII
jgi:hypothetical protein